MEGSNFGGHGTALTALGSATCIRRKQPFVINKGLKEGGQPLRLVGRRGSGPSGTNRALITIPFQPIPFLEGTMQHQIRTQFQIPTAKASGQFQRPVSSVMNSRILTLALEVTVVTVKAGSNWEKLRVKAKRPRFKSQPCSSLAEPSLAVTYLSLISSSVKHSVKTINTLRPEITSILLSTEFPAPSPMPDTFRIYNQHV